MNIIYGILFGIAGQIGSFLQLQCAVKYGWLPKYLWIILIGSIPLSWLYIKSVEYFIKGFGGEIWPSRLIGFAVGIMVFTTMSMMLFKEPMAPKTIVSMLLAFTIVAIQILWK
jgi:hypothetical protein